MFKGVIKGLVVEEAGRVPNPHSFITFATYYAIIHPTSYIHRYITICFPWKRMWPLIPVSLHLGVWQLEGANLEPDWSRVWETPDVLWYPTEPLCTHCCYLRWIPMRCYTALLTSMLYGRKAWERLLIDIWKVANNGAGGGEKRRIMWWISKIADSLGDLRPPRPLVSNICYSSSSTRVLDHWKPQKSSNLYEPIMKISCFQY